MKIQLSSIIISRSIISFIKRSYPTSAQEINRIRNIEGYFLLLLVVKIVREADSALSKSIK